MSTRPTVEYLLKYRHPNRDAQNGNFTIRVSGYRIINYPDKYPDTIWRRFQLNYFTEGAWKSHKIINS